VSLRGKWTLRADGIKVPKVEGVQASQATGGSDMNRIVIGVDIAKRVFQLHWVEPETGEIVALQLKRETFLEHFANRSKCLIGMEACGGSQHWARSLQKLGHEVKLLSGRMVKPFVVGNKNDAADARGIWMAVQQPGIKAVAVKSEEQQAVLALHRMREQLVKFRTAQINGLRGLLTEYGEVMPQGRAGIKRDIPGALGRLSDRLPAIVIDTLREQYARLGELDEQIGQIERRLRQWQSQDSATQRIAQIPGVGLLSATAAVATIGDAKVFKSGRAFAAWLGLVPRQTGTGGRVRLLGISKRGDTYLRTLLIHGARAVLTHSKSPPEWLSELVKRRPKNVAVVAMANKMARTIWALLAHERAYQSGYVSRPA
jgi:transposase